jgi:hypothetical protein
LTIIKSSLFSVLKRFPSQSERIRRLFRESEQFKSTCDDFQSCAEALQHWSQSDSQDAILRREEYAALLRELEAEIMQSLMEGQ